MSKGIFLGGVALLVEAGIGETQSKSSGISYDGKFLIIGGVRTIDFTRLDYLSLGQNPFVKEIMKKYIDESDIACPCSQIAMRSGPTVMLEDAISKIHGMEKTILFLNGYGANYNVVQALALGLRVPHLSPYVRSLGLKLGADDIATEFFVDEETHYSIFLGIKSARKINPNGVILKRFRTFDYGHLESLLKQSLKDRGKKVVRIIASDTISSMSGKVFDVQELCGLAEEYDCMLYLDEAHAVGANGEFGGGISSQISDFPRFRERLIIMGTLTKAVSQLGGYVSVSDKMLDGFLRAGSPEYIFSAPLSPWMASTIVEILEMIKGEYGIRERKKLENVASYARKKLIEEGFDILGSNSQIIPIFIGDELFGTKMQNYLREKGFTVALFTSPAVPRGKSIIRLSICSDIEKAEIDQLVKHLVDAKQLVCQET